MGQVGLVLEPEAPCYFVLVWNLRFETLKASF